LRARLSDRGQIRPVTAPALGKAHHIEAQQPFRRIASIKSVQGDTRRYESHHGNGNALTMRVQPLRAGSSPFKGPSALLVALLIHPQGAANKPVAALVGLDAASWRVRISKTRKQHLMLIRGSRGYEQTRGRRQAERARKPSLYGQPRRWPRPRS
jgi:hypothetical protein